MEVATSGCAFLRKSEAEVAHACDDGLAVEVALGEGAGVGAPGGEVGIGGGEELAEAFADGVGFGGDGEAEGDRFSDEDD